MPPWVGTWFIVLSLSLQSFNFKLLQWKDENIQLPFQTYIYFPLLSSLNLKKNLWEENLKNELLLNLCLSIFFHLHFYWLSFNTPSNKLFFSKFSSFSQSLRQFDEFSMVKTNKISKSSVYYVDDVFRCFSLHLDV